MDLIQRGIITLIRSAVTGEAFALPENFHIADAENLIVSHQIVGLAYEGAVRCGISAAEPAMNRLLQRYCQIMLRNNGQMKAVETLLTKFEENGIDHLPVKGYILKPLYPKQAMRIMTDADILIKMEQYEKIRTIMQELAYNEGETADHAMVWNSKTLEIELHRRLVPTDEPYYAHLGDGWQRAIHRGGCRYNLPYEDMYIFLFAHLVKHYRRGGIGLRQAVDLWVYRRTYPHMDQEVLRKQLQQLQLTQFHDNLSHLLDFWFEDGEADAKTEFISQFIFDSGSWGTPEQRSIFVGYQNAQKAGSSELGRVATVLRMVFPKAADLAKRYPVLHKMPWLLPVFWPVRWVSALLFRRQNIRSCHNKAMQINAESIDTFQQSLEYVGLT